MDYQLLTITANPNDPVLRQLKEAGLGEAAEQVLSENINQIGKIALNAMQAAVPYRTGQLHDEHIQISYAQRTQKLPYLSIYVRDVTHSASVGRNKISSATVADILQRKTFKRSQASVGAGNIPGGITGTTAGWVDRGFELFLREARKNLSFNG